MQLTITKEKVLNAASKCDTARQTLKILFPEAFSNSLQDAVDKIGAMVCVCRVQTEGKYVKVPLPSANREWTLEAFDYVKRFCETYSGAYPEHDAEFNYKFIYINCENVKGIKTSS